MYERDDGIFLITSGRGNFIGQILIGKSKGTAQTVTDQVFGKPTGKIIILLGNQIAHFKIVGKLWALMELSGWIDVIGFLPVFVFGPPLTGGGKVFQPEPDRVNFTVTAGALRFFLVSPLKLTRGQNVTFQSAQLWNIWWCWGWRIIE